MGESSIYKILVANSPQALVGGEKEAYCLGISIPTTNTGTIKIGSQSSRQWTLEAGDILTFNAGECDLSEDWYLEGSVVGDQYTLMYIDKAITRNIGKPKRVRDNEKVP